jgi:hypothetical protein
MSTYLPPSLRKAAAKKNENPLDPKNFPSLGPKAAVAKGPPPMDFLARIEAGETARREKAMKDASYDPTVIANQTPEQLEANGWAILYPTKDVAKGICYFSNLGMSTKQALAQPQPEPEAPKKVAKAPVPEDDYEDDWRDCYGTYTMRGAEIVYDDECNWEGNDL